MNFDEVWSKTHYQYGEDALEQVRLGWELREQEVKEWKERAEKAEAEVAELKAKIRKVTGNDELDDAYTERLRSALQAAGALGIVHETRTPIAWAQPTAEDIVQFGKCITRVSHAWVRGRWCSQCGERERVPDERTSVEVDGSHGKDKA